MTIMVSPTARKKATIGSRWPGGRRVAAKPKKMAKTTSGRMALSACRLHDVGGRKLREPLADGWAGRQPRRRRRARQADWAADGSTGQSV